MLKKFFLNALSSFVGAWIAIVLAGLVIALIIGAVVAKSFADDGVKMGDKTVLMVELKGEIAERDDAGSLALMDLVSGGDEAPQSLESLTHAIRTAKTDDKVAAIYLNCGGVAAAPATLQALRTALKEFKGSGKKIYAYADNMSQGDYLVASLADEISLNPAGAVSFSGMGGTNIFYKGLFDKIGVQFQAVRVGKGKAAVEPYTQDTMSVVARQQSMELMDTLWMAIRRDIHKSRPAITPALIDSLINVEYVSEKPAKYVLDCKLVDKLEYRHQFEKRLAKTLGQKDDKLEQVVTAQQYAALNPVNTDPGAKHQIAVLYACGGIDDVMGGGGIDSESLSSDILDLADDDNVRALVLRVNSPGGSAFGSEQIWAALQEFKNTGKPFVVSMGDYAASGGYYISCSADRIFANPMCITGSIGIFGLIPNVQGLMEKLGLNVEMVATNPAGQFPNGFKALDEKQLAAMQGMVEDGYRLFVKRCADGRKMSVGKIEQIADGRPIAASVAKSLGLVDQLGGLQDAIDYAAKAAKISGKENVVYYPEIEMSFMQLMSTMTQEASGNVGLMRLMMSGDVAAYADAAHSAMDWLLRLKPLRAETAPMRIRL